MRKKIIALVLGLALLLAALPAAAGPVPGWTGSQATVTFLGHSAFRITAGGTTILIDPYLTGNPQAAIAADAVTADYILVTHAHGDHLGDTVAIAKRTGAKVLTTTEIARMLKDQGIDALGAQIGAKKQLPFGYVRYTQAIHGSGVNGGGLAAGFIVNLGGKIFYHAGDTALFGDMALYGRLEKIDCALLPIGDHFTMGPDDAVEAVGMLHPKIVVPMHYNTNPFIKQDPAAFKKAVETRYNNVKVQIMAPGAVFIL